MDAINKIVDTVLRGATLGKGAAAIMLFRNAESSDKIEVHVDIEATLWCGCTANTTRKTQKTVAKDGTVKMKRVHENRKHASEHYVHNSDTIRWHRYDDGTVQYYCHQGTLCWCCLASKT